jgi:transcriptional regulator with XRE-family HTH domain
LSRATLEKAGGLSKGSLWGIERGLTLITIRTLLKIANGFGLTASDLVANLGLEEVHRGEDPHVD